MAKKFVRGVTDIKTISNQDFDTNNVNDLLSDGKHNYIHRKKSDGTEEYHNLTDNIKTIEKVDNGLLTVTNFNKTKNSATLHVHHDYYKSQRLSSPDQTINVQHGENGTDETTNVDVNPAKVLEHENLETGDGLVSLHDGDTTTIKIEPTFKEPGLNLDTLTDGLIHGTGFISSVSQVPTEAETTFLTLKISENSKFQVSIRPSVMQGEKAIIEYRFITRNQSTNWMSAPTSMNEITSLLSQKQNTLTSNSSIGVDGTGLMQLYSHQMSYADSMVGSLDTYAKTVKKATSLTTDNPKLEYHFTAKLYEGKTSITIALNENDTTYFEYILTNYNRTAMINGFVFSLSGSNLTISRDSSTYYQIVSFSHIIDPSQNVE